MFLTGGEGVSILAGMTEESSEQPNRTLWHRFLGKVYELSIGPLGVQVETEVQTTSAPPRVDVVLLRRLAPQWTPEQLVYLPDGIRDCNASHVLIEFKYSEPFSWDAVVQALGYEYFYRANRPLRQTDTQMFILCASTPRANRLTDLEYEATDTPGLYRSDNRYVSHIQLIVLNELASEPHNALVQIFASRRRVKVDAFERLDHISQQPLALSTLLDSLEDIWMLPKGAPMDEVLTVERVMEIGRERLRLLLQNISLEDLDASLSPELKEVLKEAGRKEAREEVKTALCNAVEQILAHRFGTVSPDLHIRLLELDPPHLNGLTAAALDAPTLEEFIQALPAQE